MRVSKLSNKRALLVTLIVIVSVLMASVALMIGVIASEEHDYGQSIKSVQVATSAQVHIRFKYNSLGEGYDKYVYEVLDPSGTQVRTGDCVITEVEDADGVTRSLISVALKPTEMTHTVKVYPTSEEYGNGKAIERSVQQYAASVLSQSKYADSHDVVRALLNYGAQTQLKWTVATNNLANDGVFARGTNPVSAVTAVVGGEKPPETDKTGTAFTAASAELKLLENNVALSFSVTSETATTVSVKISRGDKVLVDNSVVGKDGVYTAQVGNIGVNLYDDEYTVVFEADAGESLTLNVSVLDYLSVKINDSDAEIKNIAKAMYQFYMLATKKAYAADCTHLIGEKVNRTQANVDYYWIPSDAYSSFYKCSHCFAQLSDKAVNNSVEKYMPAELLAGISNTNGSFNRTVIDNEEEFEFVRINNATVNDANLVAWNVIGNWNKEVTGKYVVMKFRIGENSNGQTLLNIYAGTSSNGQGYCNKSIAVAEDGAWQEVVIDLSGSTSEIGTANPFEPNSDGSYTLTQLQLRIFGAEAVTKTDKFGTGDYVDFAYIAFVDDMQDIKYVVDEETVKVRANQSAYATVSTATCECVTHACSEAVADLTYSYTCLVCGDNVSSVTVPAGTNYFAPLNGMNKMQGNLYKLQCENGIAYNRYEYNGGNHWNLTGGTGFGSGTTSTYEPGRYLVMKFRVPKATAEKELGLWASVGTKMASNDQTFRVGTNMDGANVSNEWQVAVVDLGDHTRWSTETGKLYISLYPNSGEWTVDVAYAATVDTLDEMKALVTDETYAYYGTDGLGGTPVEVNTKTGTHVDGTECEFKYTATKTSAKGYTYRCACGAENNDINLYIDQIGRTWNYTAKADENGNIKTDVGGVVTTGQVDSNGVTYTNINVDHRDGTHIDFITNLSQSGGGSYTTESYKAGAFMAIKIRGSVGGNGNIAMRIGNNNGITNGSPNNISIGSIKDSYLSDTEWRVLIIEIKPTDAQTNYALKTTDEGGASIDKIAPMSITSGMVNKGTNIDVAYVAMADTLEGILSVVDDPAYYYFDTTFTNGYEHRSTTGNSMWFSREDLNAAAKTDINADPFVARVKFNMNATTFVAADGTTPSYVNATFKSTVAQWIWMRDTSAIQTSEKNTVAIDGTSYIKYNGDINQYSAYENYTFNVGNAKYFVIKARTDGAADKFYAQLNVSTDGGDDVAYQYDMWKDADKDNVVDAGETYTIYKDAVVRGTVRLNFTSEWDVYVIDLEALLGTTAWKKLGNDYIIDTFYLQLSNTTASTQNFDVEYMGFVEDWSDIATLTGEQTVTQIQKTDGTQTAVVSTADGSAVEAN